MVSNCLYAKNHWIEHVTTGAEVWCIGDFKLFRWLESGMFWKVQELEMGVKGQ